MDERIKAIREDKTIGRGTCSAVDECWTDSEILEHLNFCEVTDTQEAVYEMKEVESILREREREARNEIF